MGVSAGRKTVRVCACQTGREREGVFARRHLWVGVLGRGFVNDQVCVHRDGVCGRGVDLEGGQHSGKPVLPTSTVDQEPSSLSVPSTGEYRGWN